jgi:hypothetical protein
MTVPRTLVCIIAETRSWKITWPSFKTNVLDALNADLALCIGMDDSYNQDNPFWQTARYLWTSKEYEDYGDGFDEAQSRLIGDAPALDWRTILRVKDQWLGGIKGHDQHPGSAGILIYFRWLLLERLRSSGALEHYDRFVITRSDFVWLSAHPSLEVLTPDYIWMPDGENYGGLTDRHVVLARDDVELYLNLMEPIVCDTSALISAMQGRSNWNLESYIKQHLRWRGALARVKLFPYLMYSVRERQGSTRWARGVWNNRQNCFIKYISEYAAAQFWRQAVDLGAHYKDLIRAPGEAAVYVVEVVGASGRSRTAKLLLSSDDNAFPMITCMVSGKTAHVISSRRRDMILLVGRKGYIGYIDSTGRLSRWFLGLRFACLAKAMAKWGIPSIACACFGYRLLSIKRLSR